MRWHPDAVEELRAAAILIERERRGYGRRLVQHVSKKLEQAATFPNSGTDITGLRVPVQAFVLQRFPFKVIIATEYEELIVVAIAHAKRRPDYWHDRVH